MADGNFDSVSFDGSIGGFDVDAVATATQGDSYGSRRKKQVRGPYSDPAIFDEYVRRSIAEREAPRTDTQKAALQEALLHEVETRRQQDVITLDVLSRENEALRAVIDVERNRRDLQALKARAEQIAEQYAVLERQESARDELALMRVFNEFMES